MQTAKQPNSQTAKQRNSCDQVHVDERTDSVVLRGYVRIDCELTTFVTRPVSRGDLHFIYIKSHS